MEKYLYQNKEVINLLQSVFDTEIAHALSLVNYCDETSILKVERKYNDDIKVSVYSKYDNMYYIKTIIIICQNVEYDYEYYDIEDAKFTREYEYTSDYKYIIRKYTHEYDYECGSGETSLETTIEIRNNVVIAVKIHNNCDITEYERYEDLNIVNIHHENVVTKLKMDNTNGIFNLDNYKSTGMTLNQVLNFDTDDDTSVIIDLNTNTELKQYKH